MNDEKQHPFSAGLKEKSRMIKDPAGRDVRIIEDDPAMEIASETGRHPREVFVAALRGFTFEVMQYPSDYSYERERDSLTDVLAAYLDTLERQ